jgi:hypothetical protein
MLNSEVTETRFGLNTSDNRSSEKLIGKYSGMPLLNAACAVMKDAGRPLSTQDIAKILKDSQYPSNASNLTANLYTTLSRTYALESNIIHRDKKIWSLKEQNIDDEGHIDNAIVEIMAENSMQEWSVIEIAGILFEKGLGSYNRLLLTL